MKVTGLSGQAASAFGAKTVNPKAAKNAAAPTLTDTAQTAKRRHIMFFS
jgi:hypothetical protein